MNLLDGLLEEPDITVEQIVQIQEQQTSLIGSSIYFLVVILIVPGIVRALGQRSSLLDAGLRFIKSKIGMGS